MKKQKLKKRTIVAVIVAAAVVLVGGFALSGKLFGRSQARQTDEITAVKLAKTSLRDTMSLSGTIYSDNTENVYSTLSYPVKEIFVEVGDKVKAGDVLAVLDVKDLEFEIRQAENSYESALASATEDERSLMQSRQDSTYSVQNSRLSLEKATENYETLKEELEQATSSKLVTEEKNINTALQNIDTYKTNLEDKKKTYETNKQLYEVGGISKTELETSESAYDTAMKDLESAETAYQTAVKNYDSVKATLESELQSAKREVESASINYQSAQSNLSNAQSKTSTSAYSLENQLISLEKLKEDYESAEIKAGIDGTVTEVDAVVGSSASGILFVIEDDGDLYTEVYVKEYNLAKTSVGQKAIVTADATGSTPLDAEVTYIAPKAAEGSESTTVEFETRVKINDADERLRIGMNAFAAIITGEADDVFAVSSDMIVMKGRGQYVIYTLENNVVTEVPVTIGLETATSTEISGNLTEGMLVISNPAAVNVGDTVQATVVEAARSFIRSDGNSEGNAAERAGSGGEMGGRTQMQGNVRMEGGPSGGPSGGPPMN